PDIAALDARYVHFVATERPLEAEERRVLDALLTYGPREEPGARREPGGPTALIVVIPRPGTISPWSSKATDIAHVCGLKAVMRIERGIAYTLELGPGAHPPEGPALETLAPLLYDRMTEAAVFSYDAAAGLFAEESPRPLVTVPLGRDGRDALEQANRELGLALSDEEIDYLVDSFGRLGRDPTDVEL